MLRLLMRLVQVTLALVLVLVLVTAARVVLAGRDDERRPSDAIVVLGAAQFDGTPGPFLTARLEHAKALYDDDVAPRVVTTGGSALGDRFTEAESARTWLVERGVPADDVVALEEGTDTIESLQAAGAHLREQGWRSAVVVTDPPHLLRAVRMLDDQGIDAVGSGTPDAPDRGNAWARAKYVARETAAYLYYQWQQLTS